MTKRFLKYVIPSMVAFALSGIYSIVDGFFVGNSIGDIGLAAINVAYPVVAIIHAVGTGIGMGGAVQYSIYHGAKQYDRRNRYFWVALGLLIMASLLIMITFIPSISTIMKFFGASGTLLAYGEEYLFYILVGAFFSMMSVGLVPFIRNMGGANQATAIMISGFITNIGLDYLLVWVFDLGMKGAAIATIAGEAVAFLFCAIYLVRRLKNLKMTWSADWKYYMVKILTVGISPFGITFAPYIMLILINKSAVVVGGDLAVSEYAVAGYIICVVGLLLQGISDGCQPLMSLSIGERDYEGCRHVRRLSYVFSIVTALTCCFVMYVYRSDIAILFGASDEVVGLIHQDLGIFLVGFIFVAISRTTMSYFYATGKNKRAYALIYGESISLLILLLILPGIWGIQGTWVSVPFAQLIICIFSIILLKRSEEEL